jgi:hypothetical protein
MLRTTAVRLSEFLVQPIDQLDIEALVDVRPKFSAYLRERRYSVNSIRTYCQNSQRLLRWAEELGWVSRKQSVEETWAPVIEAFKGNRRKYTSIIRQAIGNGITPADFSGADLEEWGESMLRSGRQFVTIRMTKSWFRKAVVEAGLGGLLPKLEPSCHNTPYRIRPSEFPEPLKSEVRDLLVWKQARYSKGRPQWTRHRPVSAKLLESNICRLYGFATNIGNFTNVNSLPTLFTEEILSSFVDWGINQRNLSRSTLLRMSMLYGAMRHHPKYSSQDYGWFTTLFDEVPEDDQSLVQEKKARKFVPLDVLRRIPETIRMNRLKMGDSIKSCWLAHDELLMRWLTTLPWRQRNIRECRIGSPETANLFLAPLPPFIHVAKPQWVEDALQHGSQQAFWQFYFRKDETKTGMEVRGVLPRVLIPALEEHLAQHRPRLVAKRDPGTLFLNRDGGALNWQTVTSQVSEIVRQHTGRSMNPHLFRDAFSYAYLESHPEDFLTLSKILWHASVKYTLSVYGRNFDESNGARRIDEWLGAPPA